MTHFAKWPVNKLNVKEMSLKQSKVRFVALHKFNVVGEISHWTSPHLVTTRTRWFSISAVSAKSEGQRTIRFRMGHDISSKQHNIF